MSKLFTRTIKQVQYNGIVFARNKYNKFIQISTPLYINNRITLPAGTFIQILYLPNQYILRYCTGTNRNIFEIYIDVDCLLYISYQLKNT